MLPIPESPIASNIVNIADRADANWVWYWGARRWRHYSKRKPQVSGLYPTLDGTDFKEAHARRPEPRADVFIVSDQDLRHVGKQVANSNAAKRVVVEQIGRPGRGARATSWLRR